MSSFKQSLGSPRESGSSTLSKVNMCPSGGSTLFWATLMMKS